MYREYAYPVVPCGGVGAFITALGAICLKSTSSTYIGDTTLLGAFGIIGTALASLPIGFILGVLFAVTVNTGFLMRAPLERAKPALGNGYMISGYGYMPKSMLLFRVWGRWMVLTSVGWCSGVIALGVLSALIGEKVMGPEGEFPFDANLVMGLWMGLAVSLAQKVAVRYWMRLSLRWVWAAVITIGSPFALIEVLRAPDMWLIAGAVAGGALCGFLQIPFLRPYTLRTYWWVFVNMVCWGLAWFLLQKGLVAGLILSPVILGGITGLCFIALRKSPGPTAA